MQNSMREMSKALNKTQDSGKGKKTLKVPAHEGS